jgi:hypothetical protein
MTDHIPDVGKMAHIWPDVMNQPIDAPYYPNETADYRRQLAIADGLMIWAGAYGTEVPPQFGHVLMKLAEIAGGCIPNQQGFMAAADALPNRSPAQ